MPGKNSCKLLMKKQQRDIKIHRLEIKTPWMKQNKFLNISMRKKREVSEFAQELAGMNMEREVQSIF